MTYRSYSSGFSSHPMIEQFIPKSLIKFIPLMQRFFYFGIVGAVGFLVDWASLSLFRHIVGLRIAALLAYVVASSNNWILNRYWTFRDCCRKRHKVHHQWGRFVLANLPGFIINRGIVLALFSLWPLTRHYTVIALLCGTAGGMFINFTLCHHFVFHKKKPLL